MAKQTGKAFAKKALEWKTWKTPLWDGPSDQGAVPLLGHEVVFPRDDLRNMGASYLMFKSY